jgi:hypothetical protein
MRVVVVVVASIVLHVLDSIRALAVALSRQVMGLRDGLLLRPLAVDEVKTYDG